MIFNKKKNQKQRLQFIDFWAEYMKNHKDKEWSRQQAIIIDSVFKNKTFFSVKIHQL